MKQTTPSKGSDRDDLVGHFEVHRIPLRQLMTIDGLDAVTPGHRTYGLVEFDVTTANRRIAALRSQGHRLSLTTHVVSCLGWALAQNPALNSVRAGRSVYRFEDVDVNLSLEIETPRGRFPHQLASDAHRCAPHRHQVTTAGQALVRHDVRHLGHQVRGLGRLHHPVRR